MEAVEPSDGELIARLARGDGVAFDLIYARYHLRVYRFLARLSRSNDVADDLFQETWVRLGENARDLREDTNLPAWLFTVGRNLFLNHVRVQGKVAVEAEATAPEPNPEERAETRDSYAHLERAMAQVSGPAREVLLLVGLEGLDAHEAAGVLGLSHDACRQRLSRARSELVDRLRANDAMRRHAP